MDRQMDKEERRGWLKLTWSFGPGKLLKNRTLPKSLATDNKYIS